MASNCKRRIKVGTDEKGKPIMKWPCGRTEDEVNDSIVRLYIEYGLIESLLPSCGAVGERVKELLSPTEEKVENGTAFGVYTHDWMRRYKSGLKDTTRKGYLSYLNKHLLLSFGNMNLLEISIDDIQDYLNDRKDLARKTLREHLVFLRQIFDSAIEDGRMLGNPARSKKLRNPSDKVTVREALPLEVVIHILRDICGLREIDRRLMALLLLTGMRRGEVLGLRWDDIDFEKKTIYVRRNVTYPTNQPNITSTKTENGMRQIPLDDNLAILLDRPEHPRGFIVGGRRPITLTAYNCAYERIEKQVDLHDATAHIFRHSYLTMLDAAGVDPKTLQVIAGHGDIRITMNRYVHEREKDIEAAGVKLNNMMNVTLEPRSDKGKEQETSAA